jgi:hypothetical protein
LHRGGDMHGVARVSAIPGLAVQGLPVPGVGLPAVGFLMQAVVALGEKTDDGFIIHSAVFVPVVHRTTIVRWPH